MKAIVLAGGYATRLRPISYVLPKLLFPVLGKPMIFWTLDMLRDFGVDEVVLGVNYLADSLRAEVGENYRGIRIRYSLEENPLGTAGPIKLASRVIHLNETFIAMNGDVIAQLELEEMLKRHNEADAAITDALHEVTDPSRFGVVEQDSTGKIVRFVEKPKKTEAPSRLVNAGVYMIEPEVLRLIPSGRKVSLEREIFPNLARKGKLEGYAFSGFWFDIGDMSDYQRANFALLRNRTQDSQLHERSAKVARSATVHGPCLIGEKSIIEGEVSIGPYALIGKSALIMRRSKVSNSILFDHVTVGEESVVSGSIIASHVKIGKKARINSGSILSPNVQINDGVSIGKGVIIHPHKEISATVRSRAHVM
jgi:mannose-1-phosphate guanylyltransferase